MSKMNKRTTFALDEETIQRLKRLAHTWHVSQAAVVRKAVEIVEKDVTEAIDKKLSLLHQYHEKKGIASDAADSYLCEVADNRSKWGREK